MPPAIKRPIAKSLQKPNRSFNPYLQKTNKNMISQNTKSIKSWKKTK